MPSVVRSTAYNDPEFIKTFSMLDPITDVDLDRWYQKPATNIVKVKRDTKDRITIYMHYNTDDTKIHLENELFDSIYLQNPDDYFIYDLDTGETIYASVPDPHAKYKDIFPGTFLGENWKYIPPPSKVCADYPSVLVAGNLSNGRKAFITINNAQSTRGDLVALVYSQSRSKRRYFAPAPKLHPDMKETNYGRFLAASLVGRSAGLNFANVPEYWMFREVRGLRTEEKYTKKLLIRFMNDVWFGARTDLKEDLPKPKNESAQEFSEMLKSVNHGPLFIINYDGLSRMTEAELKKLHYPCCLEFHGKYSGLLDWKETRIKYVTLISEDSAVVEMMSHPTDPLVVEEGDGIFSKGSITYPAAGAQALTNILKLLDTFDIYLVCDGEILKKFSVEE